MPLPFDQKALHKLSINMAEPVIKRFATVLQSGFYYPVPRAKTINYLLSKFPGFTDEYKSNRIQTVFLNGDAIDNFEIPFIKDPSTLALSAAMPGLAGAIFRKASPVGSLRKTASVHTGTEHSSSITVIVKLFNDIAMERGPDLLTEGIMVKSCDLASFLAIRPSLIDSITNLTLNNVPADPTELPSMLSKHEIIILTCKPANA